MTPGGPTGGAPPLSAHRVYDGAEVDAYLLDLHRRLETLRVRLDEATDRASAAERRVQDSAWSEALLGRTLVLAQQTAERTIREAQDEAGAILGEARQRALTHLSSATAQAEARLDEATKQARCILDATRNTDAPHIGRAEDDGAEEVPSGPPFAPRRLSPAFPDAQPPAEPPISAETPDPPQSTARVSGLAPSSSPSGAAAGSSSVILDMRDRWRAARSGSIAIFAEAEEDRAAPLDYFAELRAAVEPAVDPPASPRSEVDVPASPRPDTRPSAFEDASYLVAFPAWAMRSGATDQTPAAEAAGPWSDAAPRPAENDSPQGGPGTTDMKTAGPFGRLGFLMLGMLSPGRMAHRRPR